MTAAATLGVELPVFLADAREPVPCRYVDPETFFEEIEDPNAAYKRTAAKAICADCPVRAGCLEHALADPKTIGIWGGTTKGDRARIRRARAALADRQAARAARRTAPSPASQPAARKGSAA